MNHQKKQHGLGFLVLMEQAATIRKIRSAERGEESHITMIFVLKPTQNAHIRATRVGRVGAHPIRLMISIQARLL